MLDKNICDQCQRDYLQACDHDNAYNKVYMAKYNYSWENGGCVWCWQYPTLYKMYKDPTMIPERCIHKLEQAMAATEAGDNVR